MDQESKLFFNSDRKWRQKCALARPKPAGTYAVDRHIYEFY